MIDRRTGLAMIGASVLAGAVKAVTFHSEPIADTRFGRVRGVTDGGVIAFKGIRYATAERFMPPRPVAPWAGIIDTMAYGAIAPQTDPAPSAGPSPIILAHLPRPTNASPSPAPAEEDEDCLFLNVWTSGLGDGRKRPVMVWLHGGFFASGSGASGDGSALARRGDVVAVSLNHRLNAFGFTCLARFGDAFKHSGSVGMLDIVAALRWIRDNIEAFGGDPDRIMVFGESGGGMKTSWLMASARARGLFHRAGIQSGPGLRFMERDAAATVTERLFGVLGLRPADIDALRTMPVMRLLAGYHTVARELPPKRFIDLSCFAPVLDRDLLPYEPYSSGTATATASIPLLIGWNGQEMSFFMGNDEAGFTLDDADLRERFENLFGARAGEADQLYRHLYPEADPGRRFVQAFSDLSIMAPTLAQADRHVTAGGNVHVYRFDRPSPALGGKLGAFHTSEAPYVFDLTDRSAGITGGEGGARRLAHAMSGAWVSFAATGKPAAAGLPAWPAYRPESRETMLFGDACRIARDPSGEAYEFLRPLLHA